MALSPKSSSTSDGGPGTLRPISVLSTLIIQIVEWFPVSRLSYIGHGKHNGRLKVCTGICPNEGS